MVDRKRPKKTRANSKLEDIKRPTTLLDDQPSSDYVDNSGFKIRLKSMVDDTEQPITPTTQPPDRWNLRRTSARLGLPKGTPLP